MVEAAGEDYDSSDIGDGIKIGPDLHNGLTDSSSLSSGGLNLQYLRPTRLYTRLKHSTFYPRELVNDNIMGQKV